jgi:hypothetical protein
MMLALDVEPMGVGDWRWRWYDHDSGATLADGVERGERSAWTAALTHYVERSDECVRALAARAEAAEQRAEAAEAALKQAQADLRVMAALGGNIVHKRYMHSPSILSDAVLNEWERAEAASAEVADGDLFAVLRRALGVAS